MKRMLALLALLALAVAGALPAQAGETLDRIMTQKKLVNAIDAEYPPFSSMGPNNEFEGFDIDVAKEFAKRLGVKIEFVTPGWDVMTAGHWAGRWGKRVGVQVATTYEKFLQKNLEMDAPGVPPIVYDFDDPQIISYDTEPTGVDDLTLGDGTRLNAMVVGVLTAKDYIKNGKPVKIVGKPLFYEPTAVAIDKGDPEFATKVKEIIEAMRADGTLK